MKLQPAIDEFLHYIEIEKNCSPHTYRSYTYDLLVFQQFVDQLYHSDELAVVCTSLGVHCSGGFHVLNRLANFSKNNDRLKRILWAALQRLKQTNDCRCICGCPN